MLLKMRPAFPCTAAAIVSVRCDTPSPQDSDNVLTDA